ncbi:MAG: 3-phosphoshikimate 1-carboxyvinyltransferase [Bacilli bacterium]|nr:3-phosphoshikimate 1-carboxyvinyltransferase [Bacilli bacterium]
MIVTIAKGKPNGSVTAPPSKSFSHRELIAGMLSGASKIEGLSYSEDILATLDCAKTFGSTWTKEGDVIAFEFIKENDSIPTFECRESGSTLRFFLPIALTKYRTFVLHGSPRLIQRGIGAYEACLAEHGVRIQKERDKIEVSGSLLPGVYKIDVTSSSQYVTGLLFALPLLNGASFIEFIGEPSSKPYIDMSLETLRLFGIQIKKTKNGFEVPGGQSYQPRNIKVEGDYSNAAFLEAFSFLGCDVSVAGLKEDSVQGDKVYREFFPLLKEGCASIDLDSSIDLAPVLFVFAAMNKGGHFTGTSRLAIKESSRAVAIKEELEKIGATVEIKDNEVDVKPVDLKINDFRFYSHNDHRIAMALSLLSYLGDVEIGGAECVKKSFPDYFKVLEKLGLEVSYYE